MLRDSFGVTWSELFRTSLEKEQLFIRLSVIWNGYEYIEERNIGMFKSPKRFIKINFFLYTNYFVDF